MNILILSASPNRNGSTRLLCDSFVRGAEKAGHTAEIADVARMNIHPCLGCIACGYDGPCVQKDDMEQLKKRILEADMLVFATPLYYYGMSAQLKTVIDRFCAFNFILTEKHKKSALLSVAWNSDDWTFEALTAHYRTLVRYLNLDNQGMVLGYGCGTVSMTQKSDALKQAYKLGSEL